VEEIAGGVAAVECRAHGMLRLHVSGQDLDSRCAPVLPAMSLSIRGWTQSGCCCQAPQRREWDRRQRRAHHHRCRCFVPASVLFWRYRYGSWPTWRRRPTLSVEHGSSLPHGGPVDQPSLETGAIVYIWGFLLLVLLSAVLAGPTLVYRHKKPSYIGAGTGPSLKPPAPHLST
jgi:hypothetical protein